jgi:hypothetical protein
MRLMLFFAPGKRNTNTSASYPKVAQARRLFLPSHIPCQLMIVVMSDVLPLLIVGAGPTGLALAHQCLRLGIRLRIIDKKKGPSLTSKAIGLQYRVSEVLAYMGLAERFLQRGGKPSTVNIYADGRRLVALRFEAGGKSGTGAFAPRAICSRKARRSRSWAMRFARAADRSNGRLS